MYFARILNFTPFVDPGLLKHPLSNLSTLSPEFKVLDTYKTGEEAAEDIPKLHPDIVIMDINLPGMSGIDCVKAVRKKTSHTQFMMFTVYENDEKVFEALKAGASGYLLKNTGLIHIVEALPELYVGGSPMSANFARKLVINFQEQMKNESPEDIAMLSVRENETLHLLSQGLLYKEIAEQLGISTSTVRQHIDRIYEKLQVQNRTEALNKAFKKSWTLPLPAWSLPPVFITFVLLFDV